MVCGGREYNVALRTEVARREVKDDAKRVAEMACYMTHCRLSPLHSALTLQSAMQTLHKLSCFATCAILARRMLDLNVPEKVRCAARVRSAMSCGMPVACSSTSDLRRADGQLCAR